MLTLWNPFLPITSIKSDNEISKKDYFDRLFEQTWNDWLGDFRQVSSFTGINYSKKEDGLTISIDLPGVSDSDLNVDMRDNMIYVKATRKTGTSTSSIEKSFSIPEGYDLDSVGAELANGVLTLSLQSLPKPEKVVKKIEVKTSNLLNK